jgi:hypothetical protein
MTKGGVEFELETNPDSKLVVERNFAEFFSEGARDHFGKCHESSRRVGRHGEAVLERASDVCGANPRAEDKGVAVVESGGWLDDD